MDNSFLIFKSGEYMAKEFVARRKGNKAGELRARRHLLILDRLHARNAVEKLNAAREEAASAKRAWKKAKAGGILFPLGEKRIQQLEREVEAAKGELVEVGNLVSDDLNLWQACGATLQDLCNLCNHDYQQAVEEIGPDHLGDLFSRLVFVYNLDYKDPRDRGWIDNKIDAPLTHAMKEYMLHLMLNTPEGRQASNEAFANCFPEIWAKRITRYVDADGDVRFVDADGVEVQMEDD